MKRAKIIKKRIRKKTLGEKNLKSKRRGGFYWDNHTPFLTVTEILKTIDKPAIRFWFGREIFYAMAKNPNLSEAEAMAAPYKSSKKAMTRGNTVHKIIETYKHTRKYVDGVPKKYQGYAKAFYEFFNHYKAKILESERTIFSQKYKYAGTLDLLLSLNGDTLPYVVDVKTGKTIYEEAFLQSSAYREALSENKIPTLGVAVLLLHSNGNYTFEIKKDPNELEDYFSGFLGAKRLYETLNKEKLIKFGYLKGGELYGQAEQ